MSRGKRLPHIATKAIKTTSKAPTFVLVAAPLPRFLKRHKACKSQPSRVSFIATCIVQTVTYAMPSLMLLVVEVIAWLSRPVCSESTVDNELRSPDIRVVLIFSNPSAFCTEPIKLVMVELSSFKVSRMVVSTALGSPPASPSESPNKLVILPLCLSKNPPAWVSHDKHELTESNTTENN